MKDRHLGRKDGKAQLHCYVTKEQLEEIHAHARAVGTTTTSYVVSRCLSDSEALDIEAISGLQDEIRRLSHAISELGQSVEQAGAGESMLRQLSQIKAETMRALAKVRI